MKKRYPKLFFLAFSLAIYGACAIPKKTPVMANIKGLDMTADQLRLKVDGFVIIFGGEVEHAADRIIDHANVREIKDRALTWKTNAISTAQLAAFQFDPLIGLLDMWAFTSQMHEFLTTGAGRDLFGTQQHIAISAAERIEKEVADFVASLGPSVNLEKAKAFVKDWVKQNPLQNLLFARRSTNISLAAYASKPEGIGEVLGGIDERMTDMMTRMNILTQQMPKIGRWQGELFLADQLRNPPIHFNTKQLQPLMNAFQQISSMVPQMPELLDRQRTALKEDAQSLSTQILQEAQMRTIQTLDDTSKKSRDLVDYIFLRLIALLLVFGAILIAFAFVLRMKPRSRTFS